MKYTCFITILISVLLLCSCGKTDKENLQNGTSSETSSSAITEISTDTETAAVTEAETTAVTVVTEEKASTIAESTQTETTLTESETTYIPETTTVSVVTEEITTASTNATATEVSVVETTKPVTATTVVTTTTKAETTTAETTTATETVTTVQPENLSPVMKQYLSISDKINSIIDKVSKERDYPVVHILTYNGEKINSKEKYNDTVIDVFNCDEEYRLTAEGGVKVRGNSSANDSVLPYRIKFNKKQNMLGLHDGKKYKSWVLMKSNWNLVPDFMALSLAEEIFNGEYYSSDCTYVNLYINGEFEGIYLLCEQNQAANDRVDIYEPKENEKQTDIGYFLEMDNYAGVDPNEPCFFLEYNGMTYTDMLGESRKVEPDGFTIKSDTYSDEQRKFIQKYMEGVFKICYEGIENKKVLMFDSNYNVVPAGSKYRTPQQAIEAVIDTKSVANMLILEELVHNYDVGAGSFFMAVDFSAESIYPRLTFLAPWDFNWAYEGDSSNAYYAGTFQKPVHDGYERSNIWLIMFMKADWFNDIVKDKWAELQADDSLNKVVAEVCEVAKSLENDLGQDESWRINCAGDIADFVSGRIKWLDTVWKK